MFLNKILIFFLFVQSNFSLKFHNIKTIKLMYRKNDLNYDIYNNIYYDINHNILTAEHIFCKSFIKNYYNAHLDAHNIFLTSAYTNTYRSNYKYIDTKNIDYVSKKKFNFIDSNNYRNTKNKLFLPCNYSRGIIARTIKYMLYNYDKLLLEDIIIDEETLEKWDINYPPTKFEIKKNELIYKFQGNKNIFIN